MLRRSAAAKKRRWWPAAISVAIIVHLTAIIIGPFAFATRSGPDSISPLALAVMNVLRPYTEAAYLNHGYAFFAPDPGPSYLIRYRLEFDDGRAPVEGTFPDLQQHWPRLLYHRHFMLSEQLNSDYVPPRPPPGLGSQETARWKQAREIYVAKWGSFERHLLSKYGADRLTMVRVQHRLPAWIEVRQQRDLRLDDKTLYREIPKDVDVGEAP
jgi:hypothetical protein